MWLLKIIKKFAIHHKQIFHSRQYFLILLKSIVLLYINKVVYLWVILFFFWKILNLVIINFLQLLNPKDCSFWSFDIWPAYWEYFLNRSKKEFLSLKSKLIHFTFFYWLTLYNRHVFLMTESYISFKYCNLVFITLYM